MRCGPRPDDRPVAARLSVNTDPPQPSNTRIPSQDVDRLVAAARAGDEDAFGELVRMFHERVYAVIYRMVSQADDARDLAQQAWVKAWQRLGTYKQESQFFTWIYRIAVNTAMDHLRKQGRRKEVSLDAFPVSDPKPSIDWTPPSEGRPDRRLEQEEIRKAFQSALASLGPEHRTALVLREVEGLSYQEIAGAMKCRMGTVMSRIFYARRLIQEHMKELR